MADTDIGLYNTTKPCILAHPNLMQARGFGPKGKETGEPKFGASFVFEIDSADLAEMKKIAGRVAKAKWPNRELKGSGLSFPFVDGTKLADKRQEKSGKDDGAFQRGKVILKAKSKYEPRLAGIENGKLVDYEGPARAANGSKFFFGAEVLAQFNFVPFDTGALQGVTCYLNMVLATGKGTKIAGGGSSAAEAFRGYVGSTTTEDPTGGAGLSDEIAF